MHAKIVLFLIASLALPTALLASPVPDIVGSCNSGTIQCCQQSFEPDSAQASDLLGLLGLSLSDLVGKIGTSCTPITPNGGGSGSNCHQDPMCCTGNGFGGLVSLGCIPINVSL